MGSWASTVIIQGTFVLLFLDIYHKWDKESWPNWITYLPYRALHCLFWLYCYFKSTCKCCIFIVTECQNKRNKRKFFHIISGIKEGNNVYCMRLVCVSGGGMKKTRRMLFGNTPRKTELGRSGYWWKENFFLPIYCSLSEGIRQSYWRSLLMACNRYIQWYISYFFKFNHDWCLAPHRWGF